MKKLSVIILTQDEERDIKGCLESANQVASEIIIVDSGSIDCTLEIAKKFEARIYQKKLENFGEQRNFGASKASNDWVLNLDADERLAPGLIKEIQKATSSSFDGLYLPFKNYFLGHWIRHSGWYPQFKLRVFRKSKMSFGKE